ncbi:MAG: protoporphyrinogen oxidase [Gemmatimonadetes bacterium]|nr:protoporphyrinogen oxidase [Gemmatimonadota bacterium]NNF11620.1 protoporphyrinogen oxidase [Gemmatimonadota bacterium]
MIVVVGGGITGLATGFELQRAGADVVVLEASDRPGGVIRSDVVDGRLLDWGPQRARMTPGFRRLVEALGLEDEVVTAPPDLDLHIYRDGRLRRLPFSMAEFAGSDVVSLRGKLRGLLEVLSSRADPDEAVSDFFTRKFGKELYETIIGPLYGGLYASDPADMRVGLSLIHALREFRIGRSLLLPLLRRGGRINPPPPCSFRDGMQALPDALAHALGRRLRTSVAVDELQRAHGEWAVRTSTGETIQASHVVLATPAPVASKLLSSFAPAAAAVIGSLRYNGLGVVHLTAETELRGIGFKVAFSERELALTGATFNDQLFGRRGVYTAYLGGARHPEVDEMDDQELGRVAVRDFRRTTGYDARVLSVARERMPAWDVSWAGLSDIAVPQGIDVAGNWWSRPGLPGRLAEATQLAKKVAHAPGDGVVSSSPS